MVEAWRRCGCVRQLDQLCGIEINGSGRNPKNDWQRSGISRNFPQLKKVTREGQHHCRSRDRRRLYWHDHWSFVAKT